MFSSTVIVTALLAGLNAVRAASDHQIVVGGAAGLVFTPNSITAAVGDTVTFVFQSHNHSVTQSSFASPCALLTNATTSATGFDSGFVPVATDATEFPAWTVMVTTISPLWFFCAQANHCQSGMVGAINAATTGNKTFAAFRTAASAAPPSVGSGSQIVTGVGARVTGSVSSIAASDVSSVSAAATTGSGSGGGSGYGSGYGSSNSGSGTTSAAQTTTTGGANINRPATGTLAGLALAALLVL